MYKYLNNLLDRVVISVKPPNNQLSLASPASQSSSELGASSSEPIAPSSKPATPLDISVAKPRSEPEEEEEEEEDGPLSSSFHLRKLPTVIKKIPSPTFSSPNARYEIPSEKEIASFQNSARITRNTTNITRLTPSRGSPPRLTREISVWLNWYIFYRILIFKGRKEEKLCM
jgi:hypothetical protein